MSLFFGFEEPESPLNGVNKDYVDNNYLKKTDLATKVTQLGDADYVKKTDHMQGTATGNINMDVYKMYQSTPPTVNNHLVNKRYVVSNFVIKGDQLQGTAVDDINMDTYNISQSAAPTADNHLANKKYITTNFVKKGDKLKGAATGNIMMGNYRISQSALPTTYGDIINVGFVATHYVAKVDKLKGAATGDINMSNHVITQQTDPTNANHLSNKYYVDTSIDDKTLDLYSMWWICNGINSSTYTSPKVIVDSHTPPPPMVLSDDLCNSPKAELKIISLTFDTDSVPATFAGIYIDFQMDYNTKTGVQGSKYLGNVALGVAHKLKDSDNKLNNTFYINVSVNLHNTLGAALAKKIRFFYISYKQSNTVGGATLNGNESVIFVSITN